MKPARRLGEPMIAAVTFYLLLQWVAPAGASAAQADTMTGAERSDQALKRNRTERTNTDGTPTGPLFGDENDQSSQMAGRSAAGSAAPKSTPSRMENGDKLREAQNRVAPHSMLIESSLRSALGQADGIRAQLREADSSRANAPLTKDQLSALSSAGREVLSDLDTAQLHRTQLREGLDEFPDISDSREFKTADKSFADLFLAERGWRDRMVKPEYWQNRSQALTDLAQLQDRIRKALGATRNFNLTQLNLPQSTLG